VLDIFRWVRWRVRQLTGNQQTPVLHLLNYSEEFPVAYYAGGEKQVKGFSWSKPNPDEAKQAAEESQQRSREQPRSGGLLRKLRAMPEEEFNLLLDEIGMHPSEVSGNQNQKADQLIRWAQFYGAMAHLDSAIQGLKEQNRQPFSLFRFLTAILWSVLSLGDRIIWGLADGLRSGALAGVIGCGVAAVCLWTVAVILLFNQVPVDSTLERPIELFPVPRLPLPPAIGIGQLNPPPMPENKMDSLNDCVKAVWAAVATKETITAFLAWCYFWALLATVAGCCGRLLWSVVPPHWGTWFEAVVALGGLLLVVAVWFRIPEPWADELKAFIPILLTVITFIWYSISGFHFRGLLYLAVVVVILDLEANGLPKGAWPAKLIWDAFMFFFVAAAFGLFTPKKGEPAYP
jgi:hypothetical protein